jgi:hypothetical protein
VGDELRLDQIRPVGGVWAGLLFENPQTGYAPALTWSFEIECAEIDSDGDGTSVGVTVEWLPLPGAEWRRMVGLVGGGEEFGEPVESSVYFFEHHCYERALVEVLDQEGERIRVRLTLAGDLDGLGPSEITCEQWLDFDGLRVLQRETESAVEATARLAAVTSVEGLAASAEAAAHGYLRLVPVTAAAS